MVTMFSLNFTIIHKDNEEEKETKNCSMIYLNQLRIYYFVCFKSINVYDPDFMKYAVGKRWGSIKKTKGKIIIPRSQ